MRSSRSDADETPAADDEQALRETLAFRQRSCLGGRIDRPLAARMDDDEQS
jgi:hypothetical protein